MKKIRKTLAGIIALSIFASNSVFISFAASEETKSEQNDATITETGAKDHYGPNTDEFESLEKLDIDTTTHYRSAVEDKDREVYIYSGVSKSGGRRETYKAVLRPSCITFKVKSEASEEEILKILRKYFDDTKDDHLLITPVNHHETLGIDTYGVSRSDSKDLIDYQLAETVYEDIKAYADVVLFLYSPSYLQLQHCFAGDLEYSVDDYDVIAAYVKDNGLPFKVEIAESELGKTKTIVRIENKKETEPIVLREAIYKTTGIWGSTPVYYDEGIVNEPKSINFAEISPDVSDKTEPSVPADYDKKEEPRSTGITYIRELVDSGLSAMEVLEKLAETGEYNDVSCQITVKPGTGLDKLEEHHHVFEAPYDDVYYVNGSPEVLMQYGSLENVVSVEIRFPQTDDEYKKEQVALFKKILSEPHTENNAPYLILDTDETADITEIILPDSQIIYTQNFPQNSSVRYYIEASDEVLSQYLEWYENTDVPYLKAFTITVPAQPANTGDIFYPIGDINHNTVIDITDLTELSLYLLGDRNLTEEQLMFADVDFDEEVSLADLARLQQYLAKKITSFT